jgi:SUN domain-containing protein 1/2
MFQLSVPHVTPPPRTTDGDSNWVAPRGVVVQDSSEALEQIVQRALLRLSKDFLGRRDFALHSGGGRVVLGITSPTVPQQSWFTTRVRAAAIHNNPDTAITDDLHLPSCWRVSGQAGQLGISLSEPISVTHVTIDHLAVDMTSDIESAPRRLVLWGIIDGVDNAEKWQRHIARSSQLPLHSIKGPAITNSYSYIPLKIFEYDIHAPSHIQTFEVTKDIRALGMDFGVVVLEILSNWGGSSTCLYRVRIHGDRLAATLPSTVL